MQLSQLLNIDKLDAHIEAGEISAVKHPDHPLLIFSYTRRFFGPWTHETRVCRGLIATVYGEVIARPYPKFYNLGEPNCPSMPEGRFLMTDKVDGSLGILYHTPDGPAIATRGSFTSEQALHATKVLRERYLDFFSPDPKLTYLFEIVYPQNRIVLDYKGQDDLVLLSVLDTETHERRDFCGPRAESCGITAELPTAQRPEREGYVLTWPNGTRIKVKHDEYCRIHKALFGLNKRLIWKALASDDLRGQYSVKEAQQILRTDKRDAEYLMLPDSDPYWDLLQALPEGDAKQWVRDLALTFLHDVADLTTTAMNVVRVAKLFFAFTRAEFAAAVRNQPKHIQTLAFLLYDEKPIAGAIWRHLYPPATPFRAEIE